MRAEHLLCAMHCSVLPVLAQLFLTVRSLFLMPFSCPFFTQKGIEIHRLNSLPKGTLLNCGPGVCKQEIEQFTHTTKSYFHVKPALDSWLIHILVQCVQISPPYPQFQPDSLESFLTSFFPSCFTSSLSSPGSCTFKMSYYSQN